MGVSKVVYENRTLIDLTTTTVTPDKLLEGTTAIDSTGEKITGTVKPTNLFFVTDSERIPLGSVTFST